MAGISRKQAREVDRICMEEYAIPGIVLMENAARGIAEIVLQRFPDPSGPIAIACGPGNNGGDGFAVARHLANAGLEVRLHLALPPDAYPEGSDAAINLAIARCMGLPLREDLDFGDAGLLLDAIFGTGLTREVREPFRNLLRAVNEASASVLAVDLPSGLDADTGIVLGEAVRADMTVTMVAPKLGFGLGQGPAHVGEVETVQIGAPPEALRRALTGD